MKKIRLIMLLSLIINLLACSKEYQTKEYLRITSPDNKLDAIYTISPGLSAVGPDIYSIYILPKGKKISDATPSDLVLNGDHFIDDPKIIWHDANHLEIQYSNGYVTSFRDCSWINAAPITAKSDLNPYKDDCPLRISLTFIKKK